MTQITLGHEQTDKESTMDKSIQKTTLYRYFDGGGRLLYVGITGNNLKRQSQHRRNSFWFGEIASATFEHFNSREDAQQAEVSAIQNEKPLHNTQHINSKKTDLNPVQMFAKYHLVSMMAGFDLNKKPIEIDDIHRNYKLAIDKFETQSDIFTLDECLVMELEHLIWLQVQGDIELPNLDKCELCDGLFKSDWYANTLMDIERRSYVPQAEVQNATN